MSIKYRLRELANGHYRLEIRVKDSNNWTESWEFPSKEAGERGIDIIVAGRLWYYDKDGRPCELNE